MNILVTDGGRACLTDFGLSRIRTDQSLVQTIAASTTLACSHRWAAPELFGDEEEDAHPTMPSDMWALGCVYYEVLQLSLTMTIIDFAWTRY